MGTYADALFTKTQQRVLGVLFGQPDRSFYAKEIIGLAASGSGAVQRELARLEALSPASAQLGRAVNPTLYTPEEFAQRIMDGKSFITRVLEQPKIFVKGSDHDISRLGGIGEPGADRQA